ncbi:DUF1460 domain-containing protein [Bombella sp. ESL0387]|nr:DUF1460 domain-containing protein [Bombella sp. ESL0387]
MSDGYRSNNQMKRRAFLTGLGLGGLAFSGPSLARGDGHHHARTKQRPLPHGHEHAPAAAPPSDAPALSTLSDTTRQQITQLVSIAPHKSRQERIMLISQFMKGTPYLAQPLIGSANTAEELILSWRGVNCMTFVEIILAASQSFNVEQFIHALIATRYSHHHVSFTERRHFLSDWLHGSPVLCRDLSPKFSYAQRVEKTLNLKLSSSNNPDNGHEKTQDRYVPGIPLKKRLITYLPTRPLLDDLQTGGVRKIVKTGDVIGIYSPLAGLDVFHIGLAIWHGRTLLFRNASSLPEHRYVVDTPLDHYLQERRGAIIYRPR